MPWCSARCTLVGMMHRTFVLTVGMLGVALPGHARGEDAVTLVETVTTLASKGEHAAAAAKASAGAANVQLDVDSRVLLGGLARASYEQSFAESRDLHDLCELSKVMRLVAALDSEASEAARQQMLGAAEEAEGRVRNASGADWRSFCGLPAAEAAGETAASNGTPVSGAAPVHHEAPPARVALGGGAAPPRAPRLEPPDLLRADQHDRRRTRIGVGTLVPGLALFAPMIGLLAYRADARRGLTELNADTAKRPATDDENARVEALDRRYGATTAAAAVLGAAAGALVVTGVVLLATGGRQPRAALAPWGGRGVGGLVLQGRF
jgi:hypothetical protein